MKSDNAVIKVEMNVIDVDAVFDLVSALACRIDDLPVDLRLEVQEIANCPGFEITPEWVAKKGFNPSNLEITDNLNVISVNPITRKVVHYADVINSAEQVLSYPDSFCIKCKKRGKVIVEW